MRRDYEAMKNTWRFFLGAAIGAGVGYALILLVKPGPKRTPAGWRVIYSAEDEKKRQTTA